MQQQDDMKPMTFKESVNCFIGCAQTVCRVLELALRKFGTAGDQFYGGHVAVSGAIMVISIILIDGGLADPLHGERPSVGLWAGGVAIALLIIHKARQKVLEAQGREVHSMYSGDSWFAFGNEIRAKGNTEPAIAFFAGVCCLAFSYGLGIWLMAASFSLAVSVSVAKLDLEARRRAVKDAMWEQRQVMNGMGEREE